MTQIKSSDKTKTTPTKTTENKLNRFLSIMGKKLGLEHMSYYK